MSQKILLIFFNYLKVKKTKVKKPTKTVISPHLACRLYIVGLLLILFNDIIESREYIRPLWCQALASEEAAFSQWYLPFAWCSYSIRE